MKIGFFTDSYKPYMSGVVKSIESFTEQLRERGHKVYIFAPDYPEVEQQEHIYRFKSIPAVTNPGFRLAIPFSTRLLQEVRQLNLDIVHTHSPFLMGWLGRVIARRAEIPLVFTYHTLYEEYAHYAPVGQELARKLAIKYSKQYCQACDMIVTPSGFVKDMLKSYGIITPMLTVPTGINLTPYNENDCCWVRENYNIGDKEKLLLFVGRLGKEKNLPFLLKSFAEISNNLTNTRLIIVGDGPVKDKLKKLRDTMKLNDRVIFAGWQPPVKVVDFYLASDLFVFPSRTETQGLVILEAMAAGLPVVAVNAAGSTVMVDDGLNGFLVRSDEYFFAMAVIDLITHSSRYHLFVRNAIKKAGKYSMGKMAERLLAGYQKLIQDNSSLNKHLA